MKTLDTARIIDIAEKLISMFILAYAAMLFIRFIRMYMRVCIYFTRYIPPFFNVPYARKRMVNRAIHEHKDAVFPINPNSRVGCSGNENQCIEMQK